MFDTYAHCFTMDIYKYKRKELRKYLNGFYNASFFKNINSE